MDSISELLLVADAYGRSLDLEATTVSWRVFGDSKKLDALRAGRDIQTRRFSAAMLWLSDNWPEGAVWPEGVVRPVHDATLAAPLSAGTADKTLAIAIDEPGSSGVAV